MQAPSEWYVLILKVPPFTHLHLKGLSTSAQRMFADFAGESFDIHDHQDLTIDLTLASPLETESIDDSTTMDNIFTCAVCNIIGSE